MNKDILKVYFVCGTANCASGKFLDILEKALKSGVTCFQFREKGETALQGYKKIELARKVKELCHHYHVPFIVNDDVSLALALDADGVHLGQEDLSIIKARELFPDKIIGLSVGSIEEYQESAVDEVDYIGVGPIFPTNSKDDAGRAIGVKGLCDIRQYAPDIPIVAIGGIGVNNVADLYHNGADGIAIISAIAQSDNVQYAVKELLSFSK